ncbi:MAG: dephospho-CoA kinase [Candidatus Levybacteria bacterium]|nr:dephospho-CoA kinase [Candidatus Levybacteria bacterium]
MRSIIGLTGAFGSGKSTAASFFESKGYRKIYLSSFLENEAINRHLRITRKNLQDLGNEMREKYGAGILMRRALESLKDEQKIVIDGLRNIGEIEELKKEKGCVLLAIVADKKVRFERLKKLKRREKLTWELFERLDLRDLGVNEKITGLQTAFCIALADAYIDSNSTIQDFEARLTKFIEIYGQQ